MTDLTRGNFKFFMGVVEDRLDPENKGRVRVRCYGLHTSDKTQIPTAALPWAKVSVPCTSPRNSSTNIIEGTQVFGVFGDGHDMQKPIVLHIIPSTFGVGDNSVGFNDPRLTGVVSKPGQEARPYTGGLATPWMNEYTDTTRYGASLGSSKTQTMATGPAGISWSEPMNPYAAIYPYNNASETESGHAIELDDTPGAERVHILHRSGSFIEFHPDGSMVYKSIGSNNSIVIKDQLVIINGNDNKSVVGNHSEKVGGKYTLDVAGDVDINVTGGNVNLAVTGNVNETVLGNVNRNISGNLVETVGGSVQRSVGGAVNETIGGAYTCAASVVLMPLPILPI